MLVNLDSQFNYVGNRLLAHPNAVGFIHPQRLLPKISEPEDRPNKNDSPEDYWF